MATVERCWDVGSQTTAALQKLEGKNLEYPHQERKRSGFYMRYSC